MNGHGWQGARRALGVLAAVAIVTGGIVGTAGSAAAAPSGAITGRVIDGAGNPIEHLCVGIDHMQTLTDEEGRYTLDGVEDGSYRVQFNCWWNPDYVREWYLDAPTEDQATPVTVVDGQTTDDIDAQLDPAAKVAGTVTDDDGAPLDAICVSAFGPSWDWLGGAPTGVDGTYTIGTLAASSEVRIQFSDCNQTGGYVTQFWDGAATFDTATPLAIGTGQVINGIDARLIRGGTISGAVAAPGPVERLCVIAVDGTDGVAYAETGGDGTYTLIGVPPGAVRVLFRDCNRVGPYADQWWDHVGNPSDATVIDVVSGGTTTGVDALLDPASAIAGRVQDVHGNPLGNICVATYGAGQIGGSARTQGDGSYTVIVPSPGAYTVQFLDCSDDAHYVGEWWDDQPTASTAADVLVGAGETIGGIDAVLDAGAAGAISGKVANLAGVPMSTACVIAYVPELDARVAPVAGDGTYTLAGLGAGEYFVAFFDCEEGGPVSDPVTGALTYRSVWAPNRPVVFEDRMLGPDPVKDGAELIRVSAGGSTALDHCFGCGAIAITSIEAGPGTATVEFSTPALYTPAGDGAAGADTNVGSTAFASSAPGVRAAADRDAAFTYTATCSSKDGGATGTATGLGATLTVAGLTAGHEYACVVTAADGGSDVADSAVSTVTLDGGTPSATPSEGGNHAGNEAGAAPAATTGTSDLATTGTSTTATLARLAVGVLLVGLGLVVGARAWRRFSEA